MSYAEYHSNTEDHEDDSGNPVDCSLGSGAGDPTAAPLNERNEEDVPSSSDEGPDRPESCRGKEDVAVLGRELRQQRQSEDTCLGIPDVGHQACGEGMPVPGAHVVGVSRKVQISRAPHDPFETDKG